MHEQKQIFIKIGESSINATYYGKMTEAQFLEEMNSDAKAHIFEGYEDRPSALKEAYADIYKKTHKPEPVAEAPAQVALPQSEPLPKKAKA